MTRKIHSDTSKDSGENRKTNGRDSGEQNMTLKMI